VKHSRLGPHLRDSLEVLLQSRQDASQTFGMVTRTKPYLVLGLLARLLLLGLELGELDLHVVVAAGSMRLEGKTTCMRLAP
jgi:hypothetical protein